MKRSAHIAAFLLWLVAAPLAYGADDPVDEKAYDGQVPVASFVAGSLAPEEAFGPTEGVLLLAMAAFALTAPFFLLIYGRKRHRRLASALDAIEALVGKERDVR